MCFICKGSSPGTWITLKCLVNKAKCYFSGLCCNFSKALRARFSFSFWLKSHMNATFLLSTYAPLYSLKYFVTHSCTFWYCSAIVTKSRCQQRHLGMLSVWGRSRHWAVQHSQTPELCVGRGERELFWQWAPGYWCESTWKKLGEEVWITELFSSPCCKSASLGVCKGCSWEQCLNPVALILRTLDV